jgi:zinc D-Ala-D-Ala carboxypeptidase
VRKVDRNGWKKMNGKQIAKMIAIVVLAIAVIVFAVREIQLYGEVKVEQQRTPTPVPDFGNVMQVTIDPSLPTAAPVLRSGSQGDEVVALQERLKELGYLSGEADGQFGPATKEAVQRFQSQHGLSADGIVGEETREILYSDSAEPYATQTPAPVLETTEEATELVILLADEEDEGLPILVNKDHPLPDDYEPDDLVNMRDYCDASIVSIKGSEIQGARVAVDALLAMLTQAQAEGIDSWQVSAGYRSVAYQQELYDEKVYEYRQQGMSGSQARSAAGKLVALPGCSEHHTGLAFDITVPGKSFGGTKQAKWLEEHCWEWGFILRYPADKTDITGITNEPWHFRYVGIEAATEMHETGECLEEYIERKQSGENQPL